jgi:hypothetical protein
VLFITIFRLRYEDQGTNMLHTIYKFRLKIGSSDFLSSSLADINFRITYGDFVDPDVIEPV